MAPPPRDSLSVVPSAFVLWGRAAVLGTVAMLTGTVSHVLGDGRLPGAVALAVLLTVCVALAAGLLRVRASALRLVVLVVVGQTFVHAALSALAGHRGEEAVPRVAASTTYAPVAETGPRPSRFFDHYEAVARASASGPAPEDWLAHQIDHLTAQGPLMVLTHLLGAVALGLFLAVGESALWSLLRLAVARAVVRSRALRLALALAGVRRGVALSAAVLAVPAIPALRPALLDRSPRRHRGPPYLLAA